MSDIGLNIRKIRELRGLTQEHVAEQLGFKSPKPYRKLETSEHSPTLSQLEKISGLFGCSVEDIRNFDPEKLPMEKKPLVQSPGTKEERFEKIIEQQNEHISSLLEEMKRLYGVVKNTVSGGGRNVNR